MNIGGILSFLFLAFSYKSIQRSNSEQNLNLEFSISATSREARHTEIHAKDYYFLTATDFKKKVENDEFLEWEEVYKGTCYGTLKSEGGYTTSAMSSE